MNRSWAKLSAILETACVALFSAKFFVLLAARKILFYVHPRLLWLIIPCWALILLVSAVNLKRTHDRSVARSVVALPLCALLLVLVALPVQSLQGLNAITTQAAAKAGARVTDVALPADTGAMTFDRWYGYFLSGDPRPELQGKTFHASGFIASYDPDKNAVELGRMVITCCAADAYLTSFTVRLPDAASSGRLISDAWYDVTGRWERQRDGTWAVVAPDFATISAPSDPYVYP